MKADMAKKKPKDSLNAGFLCKAANTREFPSRCLTLNWSTMLMPYLAAMGLKASPIAQVARPASQILQSYSGAGSLLESYDRRMAGSPPLGVPLYIAVTALESS